jgi:hypothetical protein
MLGPRMDRILRKQMSRVFMKTIAKASNHCSAGWFSSRLSRVNQASYRKIYNSLNHRPNKISLLEAKKGAKAARPITTLGISGLKP